MGKDSSKAVTLSFEVRAGISSNGQPQGSEASSALGCPWFPGLPAHSLPCSPSLSQEAYLISSRARTVTDPNFRLSRAQRLPPRVLPALPFPPHWWLCLPHVHQDQRMWHCRRDAHPDMVSGCPHVPCPVTAEARTLYTRELHFMPAAAWLSSSFQRPPRFHLLTPFVCGVN